MINKKKRKNKNLWIMHASADNTEQRTLWQSMKERREERGHVPYFGIWLWFWGWNLIYWIVETDECGKERWANQGNGRRILPWRRRSTRGINMKREQIFAFFFPLILSSCDSTYLVHLFCFVLLALYIGRKKIRFCKYALLFKLVNYR